MYTQPLSLVEVGRMMQSLLKMTAPPPKKNTDPVYAQVLSLVYKQSCGPERLIVFTFPEMCSQSESILNMLITRARRAAVKEIRLYGG